MRSINILTGNIWSFFLVMRLWVYDEAELTFEISVAKEDWFWLNLVVFKFGLAILLRKDNSYDITRSANWFSFRK